MKMRPFFSASLLSIVIVAGLAFSWTRYRNQRLQMDPRKKDKEEEEEDVEANQQQQQQQQHERVEIVVEKKTPPSYHIAASVAERQALITRSLRSGSDSSNTSTSEDDEYCDRACSTASDVASQELVNRRQYVRSVCNKFETKTKNASYEPAPRTPTHAETRKLQETSQPQPKPQPRVASGATISEGRCELAWLFLDFDSCSIYRIPCTTSYANARRTWNEWAISQLRTMRKVGSPYAS